LAGDLRRRQPTVRGSEPTIEFTPDRVTGSAGCNGYSSQQLSIGAGSFESGVSIELGQVAGNAALCDDPEVMDVETHFIEILADVAQIRLESDQLILEGPHGRLRFERIDVPQ
jgi:heat shock protein HslJ